MSTWVNTEAYREIRKELDAKGVQLVAVSKTKPAAAIEALYALGQRDFGENYVQELVEKEALLPKDIRWHFIGHLQSNKVKYIVPFVSLVHGVDSVKLLLEINKQGQKHDRVIDVLLQVHIAREETKFGMDATELENALQPSLLRGLTHIRVKGLMGMASFTQDATAVRREMQYLHSLFRKFKEADHEDYDMEIISMGMSGDYALAVEEGSNMVRIGSLLFGAR